MYPRRSSRSSPCSEPALRASRTGAHAVASRALARARREGTPVKSGAGAAAIPEGTTSVPAEGPAYGLGFARHCEFHLRTLQAQKWHTHRSRTFGAA